MPSPVSQHSAILPLMHRRATQSLIMLTAIIILWPDPTHIAESESAGAMPGLFALGWQLARQLPLRQQGQHARQSQSSLPSSPPPSPDVKLSRRYAIEAGDSLSRIFSRQGFSQQQMQQVMAADQSLLALDILRPGHILTFELDDHQQLLAMELFIHAGNRILYQRDDNGEFSYQELLNPGKWQSTTLVGAIQGSFYQSALSAGLNDAEIATVQQLFGDRLDFSRDIQVGDHFQVVRSDNYVAIGSKTEATGLSRIEGVRLFNRRQQFTAFLHDNGQYYAANGDSLERAFMRVPLAQGFRISDDFHPRRMHPVTGKVRPHNGTDFATPTGSAVLASAEGRVIRVEHHPFAGRYVEIQHHGQYKSRYLHLSKALVRPGQQVSRGQRIALSGATGRVTGAHLHYELHINNRPVDPMNASIPLATPVPAATRDAFFHRVALIIEQMELQTLLARQQSNKAEARIN